MSTKFNPKSYQNRARIYRQVLGSPRISKLFVWDNDLKEYRPPIRGKSYRTRKYVETTLGKMSRVEEFFETVEDARTWQNSQTEALKQNETPQGMLFGQVVQEWKGRRFPSLQESTCLAYEKIIALHFQSLMNIPILEINPHKIDLWIDELKNPESKAMRSKTRSCFDHEITLLGIILRYYDEYHDDLGFRYPLKRRHKEASRLNRPRIPKKRDLTEAEFLCFRKELEKESDGVILSALATVQYYQALRISEACGLYWEDVQFDWNERKKSKLRIVRSVTWPRKKGHLSKVVAGFKNAKSNEGEKEQPLFPETFDALASLYREGVTGLVFPIQGTHVEYRQIQFSYDRSFKRAKLPYSGSHIMRHGGCRRVYNIVADPEIAKQLLGNSTLETTLIYAKRDKAALSRLVEKDWDETGSKWVQPTVAIQKVEEKQNDKP